MDGSKSDKYRPRVEKIFILLLLCYIVLEHALSAVVTEERVQKASTQLPRSTQLVNNTTNISNATKVRFFNAESLSLEDRFADRKAHLLESCRHEGILGLENYLVEEKSLPRPNILYLDEYQLMYCGIPKVGFTNWMKVFLYLSGALTPEKELEAENGRLWKAVNGAEANDIRNLQHMNFWNLNQTERIWRLNNYQKFLVVREPFERLLSAYRNKLEPDRDDNFGDMSFDIHRKVTHTVEKEKASFQEFLEALVDHSPNSIPENEHWATYWRACFPCDIQYDYILKLETMQEDLDWLFDKFNITKIAYPKGNKIPSNANLLETKYLSEISHPLQKAVYQYLKKDYDLFGYSMPDSIL